MERIKWLAIDLRMSSQYMLNICIDEIVQIKFSGVFLKLLKKFSGYWRVALTELILPVKIGNIVEGHFNIFS